MRPLLPALLAAASLGLSACTPTQVLQVPTVEVQSVRLTSLSLPGGLNFGAAAPVANLAFDLRVTNPNAVPLRLANVNADLIVDGSAVGQVTLPNVDLPARGVADQRADVALPVTLNTAASFLKVARGQLVTYRLDGTFSVNFGPLGTQTFGPFTFAQGQWQQPAILPF